MERRIIVENKSNENEQVNILPSVDCAPGIVDCSEVINRIVDRGNVNRKHSHRGSSYNDVQKIVEDFASVTTGPSISPSVDCAPGIVDCSDRKSWIVSCNTRKRSHKAKSNTKDSIVKDFALSHHTDDFCKTNKFSLKAMESIMKECLIAIGAQAVINPTSYKQLKKEIFDCIPYSDWFSPETFPTTLKLNHEDNGFLF